MSTILNSYTDFIDDVLDLLFRYLLGFIGPETLEVIHPYFFSLVVFVVPLICFYLFYRVLVLGINFMRFGL